MAQHVAKDSHRSPLDYNRTEIRNAVESLQDMILMISEYPENFAVVDVAMLHETLISMAKAIEVQGILGDYLKDWTHLTA